MTTVMTMTMMVLLVMMMTMMMPTMMVVMTMMMVVMTMIPCDNSFFAALLRQVGERVWHEPVTYRIEIQEYEETGSIQI